MKKYVSILLVALLLCALCVPALADEDKPVVRVTGNATVTLAADTATLQIGAETKDVSVEAAQAQNNEIISKVIAALKEAGVDEKDMITSNFNVYSTYDYSWEDGSEKRIGPFYQVSNMLTITIRNLDVIGEIIDAASKAGANVMYGLTFTSTSENEAYQKALTRAVEDAAQKAQVLATATGKALGELILVDASQGYSYYGISNTFDMAKGSLERTTIVAGDVSVSASVVLEYQLK